MWIDRRSTYVPRAYRPRLFPRLVRWCLFGICALAFVYGGVLLMVELNAIFD